MNLLSQATVIVLLKTLSFLCQKGILHRDQAFTFFQSLPISDTTIKDLLPSIKAPVYYATKGSKKPSAKYYKDPYDR